MLQFRPLHSLLVRGAVAALLTVGAALTLAPAASGVVAYRAASCTAGSFFWGNQTHTIAKPAGTAAGDVVILTVRGTLTGTLVDLNWPNAYGWTLLHDNGENGKSYYRVATAGDPANYNVMGYSSATFPLGKFAFTAVSYSGASGVTPLAGAGASSTGSSSSVALPNTTALQAGSMRHSSVTRANTAGATYPAGMTENCEDADGVAVSSGREAVGAGATPSRTVTYGSSAAWVAHTYVINPAGSCESGSFTLTPPASVSFPATALNGLNQVRPGLMTWSVDDQRGGQPGWNVSLTTTRFQTAGGNSLPLTATTITGGSATAGAGNCVMPTNSVTYPLVVPAGVVAPPAVKIFNAAAASGVGPTNVDTSMSLLVPSFARAGAYTSTWTFTLSTGP